MSGKWLGSEIRGKIKENCVWKYPLYLFALPVLTTKTFRFSPTSNAETDETGVRRQSELKSNASEVYVFLLKNKNLPALQYLEGSAIRFIQSDLWIPFLFQAFHD